jgi:hypothetical protein
VTFCVIHVDAGPVLLTRRRVSGRIGRGIGVRFPPVFEAAIHKWLLRVSTVVGVAGLTWPSISFDSGMMLQTFEEAPCRDVIIWREVLKVILQLC